MKIKEYSIGDMTKVTCSSCGNEMECPKGMAQEENHVCHICTDILASGIGKEDAKEIAAIEHEVRKHKEEMLRLGQSIHNASVKANMPPKGEIKETSKKRLAETMHLCGILTAIDFFMYAGLSGSDLKKILRSVEASENYHPGDEEKLQQFTAEIKNIIDVIGVIGEKLEKMGIHGEEFDRLIKSIDPKGFDAINEADPSTEEGLARIMNVLIFKGDWTEQLKWTEKNGRKDDTEIIKRLMEE